MSKEEVLKRRNSRLENGQGSPTKGKDREGREKDRAERAERDKARKEKEAARLREEIAAIRVGGQMEHTKQLAEGMFGRWCEGVASRWAGV
jgi:hypothetical protein